MSGARGARRLRAVVALIAVAGLLAACAPDRVPDWRPAEWPVTGEVVAVQPTVETGDAVTVGMRLRNDDVGIDARWAYLPGDQPFNAAVEKIVRAAVASREKASGTAYTPSAHPAGAGLGIRGCEPGSTSAPATEVLGGRSGSVVVCEVVLARGTVFGERMRIVTGAAGVVESDESTTLYTDLGTGEVAGADDLFDDVARIWAPSIEVLRRAAGSLSLREIAPPSEQQAEELRRALDSAVLADGVIVIPVPPALDAVELDGLSGWRGRSPDRPEFVSIEASALEGGLSPLGQAIARATGPFEGPVSRGAAFDRTPCDLVPCMAMTLDDGPSSLTPGFLDVLAAEQSAATFYMLGQNARRYPDIVRRVAEAGHEIGNHTWNHPYLTELTDEQIASQLDRTRAVLRDLSGQSVSTFRPPGGFIDGRVMDVAAQPAVMWSVDTRDWAGPADADLLRTAVDAPRVSTILLMHDIQSVSSRVFGDVVAGLKDRGFSLVTVEHLFGGTVPSGIVRHGPL